MTEESAKKPVVPTATPEQYNQVFEISPSGRIVLDDMMRAHHFYTSAFDPNPQIAAFREGERNVVLRILTILQEYREGKR